MTIVVEIRPEVEAEIARQAALQGRAVEAYAASLLEEAVKLPTAPSEKTFDSEARTGRWSAHSRTQQRPDPRRPDHSRADRRRPSVSHLCWTTP